MPTLKKIKTATKTEEVVEEVEPTASSSDTLQDIDDLLDEIDTVLEESTVAVNYRQKGGE